MIERQSSAFVDYGATSRQPLQSVLEKRVLEGRLEGAGIGVADSKSGTDFELCGAMNFQIELAASY